MGERGALAPSVRATEGYHNTSQIYHTLVGLSLDDRVSGVDTHHDIDRERSSRSEQRDRLQLMFCQPPN